ncbi:CBS domain-containing protein [Motiliproteus sp.]|uniref:CBS domain-containing protein n=1 Tax=Motiliproteus sp. TaxID=1898955 RepID=UPI003BA94BA7
MFAIHDKHGLKLRGTLELINKHKKPAPIRLNRTKAFWDETEPRGTVVAFTQQPSNTPRYLKADELYKRALKLRVNEPVVHAHQVMSTQVYTVSPEDWLSDAWRWLQLYDIKQLPVVQKGVGIVSMLSRRDIEKHIFDDHWDVEELATKRVGSIMSDEVITTEPVSSVRRIARVMVDHNQHAMPVIDNGKLAGILTRGDILRVLSEEPKLNLWA